MKIVSFNENLVFNDDRVDISLILETAHSKEMRILIRKDQTLKEHTTPHVIILHVLEGTIAFGVEDKIVMLNKNEVITLDKNIKHHLKGKTDSIVRLTIFK